MPWQKHPSFLELEDDSEILWRYMDLAKLVALLDKRALFFARATNMAANDPYEGHIPDWQFEALAEHLVEEGLKQNPSLDRATEFHTIYENMKVLNSDSVKRKLLLNCWHKARTESMAMWRIYGPTDRGIAIVTTYGRLKACFAATEPPIYIGKVRYLDLREELHDFRNLFNAVLIKRPAFEWESEVRAVVHAEDFREGSHGPKGPSAKEIILPRGAQGWLSPVDLDTLIQEIRLTPSCEDWFAETVMSVVGRYGLDKPVTRSDLDDFDTFRFPNQT